jgi:putative transposase
MANTFTQLHIQLVFAVKGRENLVKESFRERLQGYICGIVSERKHKPLAIYCMPDHTHLLLGLRPTDAVADLVRDIKSFSSGFINSEHLLPQKFEWQVGYGAFSYTKSHLPEVIKYILNQAEHHKKRSFKQEYIDILTKLEIEYDEKYLFDFLE